MLIVELFPLIASAKTVLCLLAVGGQRIERAAWAITMRLFLQLPAWPVPLHSSQ
jgi:hypothetical protein